MSNENYIPGRGTATILSTEQGEDDKNITDSNVPPTHPNYSRNCNFRAELCSGPARKLQLNKWEHLIGAFFSFKISFN